MNKTEKTDIKLNTHTKNFLTSPFSLSKKQTNKNRCFKITFSSTKKQLLLKKHATTLRAGIKIFLF